MDAEVSSALWQVEAAFVAWLPRRADDGGFLAGVDGGRGGRGVDGPPREASDGPIGPDGLDAPDGLDGLATADGPGGDADPAALVLALGVTIGGPDDVRALTPWLLHQVVEGDRIDLHTALARIAEFWGGWTAPEREAVRGVVDALWVSLLDRHPADATAVAFLDAAAGLGDPPTRLLEIWDYKDTASADHHLAELVVDAFYGARVQPEVQVWAHARPQRARLFRALERDRGRPWAGDLAAACDLLR